MSRGLADELAAEPLALVFWQHVDRADLALVVGIVAAFWPSDGEPDDEPVRFGDETELRTAQIAEALPALLDVGAHRVQRRIGQLTAIRGVPRRDAHTLDRLRVVHRGGPNAQRP